MVSKTTHLNAYVRPAKSIWVLHSPVRSAEDVETARGHALWKLAMGHQPRKGTLSL